MIPHYPTTQELAAFRRSIRPDIDDVPPVATRAPFHPSWGGAWGGERLAGIGYRSIDHAEYLAVRPIGYEMRAGASAMRSRAYSRTMVELPA